MDTQDPPNRPRYQLTRGLRGLDNKKDDGTSGCLDRKYEAPSGEYTLLGPAGWWQHRTSFSVSADRISNCLLDRVLTYKNLIYLLNLQFHFERNNKMFYDNKEVIVDNIIWGFLIAVTLLKE